MFIRNRLVILTILLVGTVALANPSDPKDGDACKDLMRKNAGLISLGAVRQQRAERRGAFAAVRSVISDAVRELADKFRAAHAGAPSWYIPFHASIFTGGLVISGPHLHSGRDVDLELENVRKFFTEEGSLTADQARASASNMAFWELGPMADLDSRSLNLLSLCSMTSQFSVEVGSRTLGQVIADYYRKIYEIRVLDERISQIYSSYLSSVVSRVGLEFDPNYGKGIYLGSQPSRDFVELDHEVIRNRQALQHALAHFNPMLAEARKLELEILASGPFFRGDGPHLDTSSLMSVQKAETLDGAMSFLPRPVRLRFGEYPRLQIPK